MILPCCKDCGEEFFSHDAREEYCEDCSPRVEKSSVKKLRDSKEFSKEAGEKKRKREYDKARKLKYDNSDS